MRVREMHPLCCITLASGAIGDRSPETAEMSAVLLRTGSAVVGSDANAGGCDATCVAGVLYKWTNYHKGWRSRWFNLRNGVISYSKTRHPDRISFAADDVKLIGHLPSDDPGRRKHRKTIRIVHLKAHWSVGTRTHCVNCVREREKIRVLLRGKFPGVLQSGK